MLLELEDNMQLEKGTVLFSIFYSKHIDKNIKEVNFKI